MKAIVIDEFGGIEKLQMKDIDRPTLEPDRMIVKMAATSVNPVDVKRRKGLFGGKTPMIIGGDVSGTVVEVGDDVTGFKVGDRIMANGAKTYAEFVVVNPDRAVVLPDMVSFEEAAAIPLAGQTAYEAVVTRGQVKDGQKVLIHGGSGGVGSLAVQIAKIKGAWVASTASGKNQSLLKDLDVDRPVDYKSEAFEELLDPVDFVFDTVGGDVQTRSLSVIKEGGHLLSIAAKPDENTAVKAEFFSMSPKKEALEDLLTWLEEGKIRPVISEMLDFTEEGVRKAHELSETGHTGGKIILTFPE
ncbi:NADP-dependent oxidoreductase [Alkalibacterium pelagium]|uniref:NADPH:quinone reductase n=1 Tax=Alkalibacterium pelagium TaxID=426702 RepID=A0A1H7ICT4_9LACT|nr:NADP-dependent oxidoreductase [Alkalibacterium pelagium]GEN50024.1 oxidoreductase [Alkalibacterium pelagium]SEK59662.1 NADPH:quinone reductase [Alkalibacterium pelagium]